MWAPAGAIRLTFYTTLKMEGAERTLQKLNKKWGQVESSYNVTKRQIEIEAKYQRIRSKYSEAYLQGAEWYLGPQLYAQHNTMQEIFTTETILNTLFKDY